MIGPWVHGGQNSNVAGEVEFTKEAGIDLLAFRLRWYDRWLRGEKNGVDDDAPVLLYIMGTGDDRRSKAGRLQHGGFWRAEREWPLPATRPTPLYLNADGTLSSSPPAARREPHDLHLRPQTSRADDRRQYVIEPGIDHQWRLRPAVARRHPRRRRSAAALRAPGCRSCFGPAPLEADLEVTGTVEVKLWVGSTAPDTDFTAKLIDEIPPNPDYPLGFDLNLGDSILRARYREGLDHQAASPRPERHRPDHDHALSDRQRLQEGAPHQGRRLEQQLSSVRRQSQHERPAGRLPAHGLGRQHGLSRGRPSVAGDLAGDSGCRRERR